MWVNIPFMHPTGFQQKSSNRRSHNSYVGRPNDPCFHSKSQLHNSLEFIKIQSSQTTCIHFIYHLKHTADFGVLSRSCIFCHPEKNLEADKNHQKNISFFQWNIINFPHQQLSEMLKNPDRIYVPHPKHGTLARYWDSSASRPTPNFPPLHYHSARLRMGRMLEPGGQVAKWNQKPPGVFFCKTWKNMLRSLRILIFQSPKKNKALSSFLEESRDYFTKKKQKLPYFWGITCFFLKPPRLDPSNPFGWGFGPEVLGPGIFFGKLSLSHIAKAVANSRWWRFS